MIRAFLVAVIVSFVAGLGLSFGVYALIGGWFGSCEGLR